MDVLLVVLGLFGLIPIAAMTVLYGGTCALLLGMGVLGVTARREDLPGAARKSPAEPALKQAA